MPYQCYSTTTVQQGFDDPVLRTQQAFRGILTAMSRPGTVVTVPEPETVPGSLSAATCAVLLTLADMDTPVWLDRQEDDVLQYLRFHCGSPVVSKRTEASFGVYASGTDLDGVGEFFVGTAESPDRSATLIIQVPSLKEAGEVVLAGPGIRERKEFGVTGVDPAVWSVIRENRSLFPMGVDIVFTSGCKAVAVPRCVEVLSCM